MLDECEDWRLSRYIAGHDVQSAQAMGWAGLKNGALLGVAASQFDAFITVDRNLSLTPNLLRALDTCSSGVVTIVGEPGTKT